LLRTVTSRSATPFQPAQMAKLPAFVICIQTIENFFCKLKEFKRIAMRADKTDKSFAAMIYLAAAVINSR
jgi:transposase